MVNHNIFDVMKIIKFANRFPVFPDRSLPVLNMVRGGL